MTDATTTSNSEDEKALREFLLDIGCLDKLSKWTNRFNKKTAMAEIFVD